MPAAASPIPPQPQRRSEVEPEVPARVDAYVAAALGLEDEALRAADRAAAEAGLPAIQVTAAQGALLAILARSVGARAILEVGVLGGYSTIWLARALAAGGRLIGLEANPEYAAVARANLARAGLGELTEIRVGPALDSMAELAREGAGPFDLVFVDADKIHSPDYLAWAADRVRPGGLIVVDNVVRGGSLAAEDGDEVVAAQRRLHEIVAADPRLEATTVQTVGAKGYDGFTLIRLGSPDE